MIGLDRFKWRTVVIMIMNIRFPFPNRSYNYYIFNSGPAVQR